MSTLKAFVHQMKIVHNHRRLLVADVGEEDAYWRPRPEVPPIAWHVGHVAFAEASIVLGMGKGERDPCPREWFGLYSMGAALPEDIRDLPGVETMLAAHERVHARVVEFLAEFADEDLLAELPHRAEGLPDFLRTFRDCTAFLPLHEAYHNGEINVLRRAMGKPRLA